MTRYVMTMLAVVQLDTTLDRLSADIILNLALAYLPIFVAILTQSKVAVYSNGSQREIDDFAERAVLLANMGELDVPQEWHCRVFFSFFFGFFGR